MAFLLMQSVCYVSNQANICGMCLTGNIRAPQAPLVRFRTLLHTNIVLSIAGTLACFRQKFSFAIIQLSQYLFVHITLHLS